jgi:DNA-binding response OmpR family regulator
MVARVLVVEDAEAIRTAVGIALEEAGCEVLTRADGETLERDLAAFRPDLVLLDVMLPGRDGFALLAVVREVSNAGIVLLTARDAVEDRLHGLRTGADDYVVKPFAMAELVARIHAVLRRTRRDGGTVALGDLMINFDATVVQRGGATLDLTETERRMLGYLLAHRERVVSKTQILTAVWGYHGFDENVVEVHISSLRRKLEAGGASRVVHTVRGRGYRLAVAP